MSIIKKSGLTVGIFDISTFPMALYFFSLHQARSQEFLRAGEVLQMRAQIFGSFKS